MTIAIERSVVIESVEFEFVSPRKIRLSGALMTNTAQDELERVLWRVHCHILTLNIAAFMVDVTLLNFVTSSALRVFINWISRAERARYKLVFVTDPTVTWHRLNFSVLKSLSPQSVEIRTSQDGTG